MLTPGLDFVSRPRVITPKHSVVATFLTMTVPGRFQIVSVDILGPLPVTETGDRCVLCLIDHYMH